MTGNRHLPSLSSTLINFAAMILVGVIVCDKDAQDSVMMNYDAGATKSLVADAAAAEI